MFQTEGHQYKEGECLVFMRTVKDASYWVKVAEQDSSNSGQRNNSKGQMAKSLIDTCQDCGFTLVRWKSLEGFSRSRVNVICFMLEEGQFGCWDGIDCNGQEQKHEDKLRSFCNYPGER